MWLRETANGSVRCYDARANKATRRAAQALREGARSCDVPNGELDVDLVVHSVLQLRTVALLASQRHVAPLRFSQLLQRLLHLIKRREGQLGDLLGVLGLGG